MLRFDDQSRLLELGVHDLIEAGPPSGHLSLQAAWSARVRMRAGQQAHVSWQAERMLEDDEFKAEVTLRHRVVVAGWEVVVSGRIDGLTREGDYVVAEELKSTAMATARLEGATADDFGGWAQQLRLYLHFLGAAGEQAVGRLIVLSLADGRQHVFGVRPDPDMGAWLERQLQWVIDLHEERLVWLRRRRSAAATGIPFAHETWRTGQRGVAKDLVDALHGKRQVLLSAPTGYGKTAAALHAALQVAYETDARVFFATARTTQQYMAEQTLRAMAAQGLPVRAVSIRAREKACLNEVVACRPDCCPYASGYYDKLLEKDPLGRLWPEEHDAFGPAAGSTHGVPGPDEVIVVAEHDQICPFALSLDMAMRADVVIGDFNYVFDPSVRLQVIADAPGDWIVIADEAHHLPDRAMGYGSPELRRGPAEACVGAMAGQPRWAPFREAVEAVLATIEAGVDRVPSGARDGEAAFSVEEGLDVRAMRRLAEHFDGIALDYSLARLDGALFEAGEGDPWLDTARAAFRFRQALERAGEETMVIWRRDEAPTRRGGRAGGQVSLLSRGGRGGDRTGVKLLCREPGKVVGPLLAQLAGFVGMSATLEPADFHRDVLALDPDRALSLQYPSPFPAESLRVLVLPEVSTLYRHRRRDRIATAALISEAVAAVPGNVAVFFSSFAYRDQVLPLLELGDRPRLVQERGMDERTRAALLDTLALGRGHVLLGVLGGIFSEGIDLPGRGLLAAIVVGPALPAANLERRLIQAWFEERFGEGFRYAWLVPGMGRVVQAAGRVVRSATDRGAVVLVGQRFMLRDYRRFFPEGWSPVRTNRPAQVLSGLWDGWDPKSPDSSVGEVAGSTTPQTPESSPS